MLSPRHDPCLVKKVFLEHTPLCAAIFAHFGPLVHPIQVPPEGSRLHPRSPPSLQLGWWVHHQSKRLLILPRTVSPLFPQQGHLEYFICNADDLDDPEGVVTQECFNMHPLTRAEGDDVNSPIDPNFSGRYYCDPECREFETDQTHDIRSAGGYVMTMNYQLPKGLTCKRCILQMVYCELLRVLFAFVHFLLCYTTIVLLCVCVWSSHLLTGKIVDSG